jgi:type IV pilus assembly protein PilF
MLNRARTQTFVMFTRGTATAFLGFLVLSILISGCNTVQNKREAEARYQLGLAYLGEGNGPLALRELLVADKMDPNNAEIHHGMALAFYNREKYQQAEQYFKSALALRKSFSLARSNYGRLLIDLNRYDEAISQLNQVLDDLTFAEPQKAQYHIAYAYFRKKDFARAKQVLSPLAASQPEHCQVQSLMGRTQLELRDFISSAKVLDTAVRICQSPENEEAYFFAGVSYLRMGRGSAAMARVEELLKLYPNGAYSGRAKELIKTMR